MYEFYCINHNLSNPNLESSLTVFLIKTCTQECSRASPVKDGCVSLSFVKEACRGFFLNRMEQGVDCCWRVWGNKQRQLKVLMHFCPALEMLPGQELAWGSSAKFIGTQLTFKAEVIPEWQASLHNEIQSIEKDKYNKLYRGFMIWCVFYSDCCLSIHN